MGEELLVAGAEVVEARFAGRRFEETVLGTFAMAGEAHRALAAIARQGGRLGQPEGLLLGRVDEAGEGRVHQVTQLVAGVDVMVAAVEISVVLDGEGPSAVFGKNADTGWLAAPVGQGRVKLLNKDLAHVVLDPFIEDRDQELPVLGRSHTPFGYLGVESDGVLMIRRRGQPQTVVGAGGVAFHDGNKLKVTRTDLAEELIHFQGMPGVFPVHRGEGVELDLVLLEHP